MPTSPICLARAASATTFSDIAAPSGRSTPSTSRSMASRYVNFSSNNYLGLTHHPRVVEAVQSRRERVRRRRRGVAADHRLHDRARVGRGGAGEVEGHGGGGAAAERLPGEPRGGSDDRRRRRGGGTPACASCSTSSRTRRYRRGPRQRLAVPRLPAQRSRQARAAAREPAQSPDKPTLQVVVTESIFSMDGDAAPLRELAELKQKAPFFLVLDEAHGSGVYGEHGAGYAAEVRRRRRRRRLRRHAVESARLSPAARSARRRHSATPS